MPSTGSESTYPAPAVLMRVGLRAGIVLTANPPSHELLSRFDEAEILERSEDDLLVQVPPGETPAFWRAAGLAEELKACVPPVSVVLHSPCADRQGDVALLRDLARTARPGEVLVTEAYWRLAKDHYAFEALPGRLFRMGSPMAALPDVFVGRGAELQQLQACWETARLGRPLFVSIQGEAGIGKSRFLSEFLATQSSSLRVCSACSRQNEQQHPYALLASVVAALGLPVGRLAAEIGPEGADLDYLLDDRPEAPGAQPRHRQFRAFRALNQLLRERLGQSPTVLALEDLHWADEASLAWLDSLVAELSAGDQSPPWLIVCTERGREIHRRYVGLGLGTVAIALGPLPEAAAAGLLDVLAPELVADRRRQVTSRAAGNPFYLREFAQLARRTGETSALPENVRWELQHRLMALAPVERRVIELAAILGHEFDPEVLGRLVGTPGFRQILTNLAGAGLLVRRPDAVAFSHHLLHEATYASMSLARRRELHAVAAHVLESVGGPPDQVALHLLRGPRPAQARPLLLEAARLARARHALVEARDCLRRAAEAGLEPDSLGSALRLELCEVLLALGELKAADRELRALRPLVLDGDRVRLALLASRLDELQGAYASAIAALHDVPGTLGPPERARLMLAEASLRLRRGEFVACRELARGALPLAQEPLDRALARSLEGIATYRQDGPERALPAYREALALREGVGDPAAVASSLSNLGVAYYELGRWDEALPCFERALEAFRSVGERWQTTVVLNNQGHLLLNRGSVPEAEACYREALALKREMGEEPGVAIALCNLGNALSRREAYAEGRACLQEAVHLLERLGEQETLAEVYQVSGMLELTAGDHRQARRFLERALDKSHAVRRDGPRAIALRGLSQLAARDERWEDAAALAWESVQLNDRLQNPLELGRSLVAWGLAQQALGDVERAMDALDKASVLFRQLGALQDVRDIVAQLG